MRIERKQFSDQKNKRPKRPKELKDKIDERDSQLVKASVSQFAALPAAYLTNFNLRGRTERLSKNMADQVIDRLHDLGDKASKGDKVAQEFLNKANSNSDKFGRQIREAISNSSKIKRAKVASVAIPVAVGAGFLLKSRHHSKKAASLNPEIKKAEAEYKEELKEWKKKNNK